MGVEHSTGTDTKAEDADRPKSSDKPPGPPPDNPGAPDQPSRLKSLARAREPAPQENGPQQAAAEDSGARPTDADKEKASAPGTQDKPRDAANPKVEASGSESEDESKQDERVQEARSGDAGKQTDARVGGGEAEGGRDDKTTATRTEDVGEKAETRDDPASSTRQYTMPADNPGSPNQPSRLESLARAREPVRQENRPQETEATDAGSQPPAEPAVEPAPSPPENDDSKTERPQEQAPSPQQDQKPGTDMPPPASVSGSENARDVAEGVSQEPVSQPEDLPGDDLRAGAGEPDGPAAFNSLDDVVDELDKQVSGESPADDNGSIVDFDEDVLERGIPDRLKQLAAKLGRSDEPKELKGTVDRPDFQDPREEPEYIPDRYGTPLDRADGTRVPLFNGEPAREQAKQGILGDCGIIATLGAVAEKYPEAIRNCVRETEDGNYEVRFNEAKYSKSAQRYESTGQSITLTVTPEVPIKDDRPHMPAFAAITAAGTAWAPVLEKAIAGLDQTWSAERLDRANRIWKAQGKPGDAPTGYVRLNQGSSPEERAELLTGLTGHPAKTVDFPTGYDNKGRSADRRLQDEIVGLLSQGKPVLVGTRELGKGESNLPNKLIAKHAYEVTRVDDQGNLYLYNPWHRSHPSPMTIKEFKANIRHRYTTME
ncbi:hypothetical protein AB0C21_42070 [Spirillospora sp. NPDC049024]